MSLADEMIADFSEIHADLPSYVVIGGAHIPALVSQGSTAEELDLGGFANQDSLTIKAKKADWPANAKVGDILSYDRRNYRINSISIKVSIPLIEIQCLQR